MTIEIFDAYEDAFELRFLKSRGLAFQDLFSELMEKVHPGDFQRVRPHGATGDMKCDGYLSSRQIVFQVYGPDDMRRVARLLQKLEADFTGAITAWHGSVRSWVLVHNSQAGLPPQAVQKLIEFRNRTPSITVEAWGFEELRCRLRLLDANAMKALLPQARATSARDEPSPRLPDEAALRSYWSLLSKRLDEWLTRRIVSMPCEVTLRLVEETAAQDLRAMDERLAGAGARSDAWYTSTRVGESRDRLLRAGVTVTQMTALFRRHRRLVVLGEPGAGKSTLLRQYARQRLQTLQTRGLVRGVGRTPALLDLSSLDPKESLADAIAHTLAEAHPDLRREAVQLAMGRGYFVILLDGLDEVAPSLRRELLAQLSSLVRMYSKCHFVLASRPFPEVPLDFHRVEMAPLADADVTRALTAATDASRWSGDMECDRFLTPSIRYLCYRPLTLSLVASAAVRGEPLPKTLYATYDRFLTWTLGWDHGRERLDSPAIAAELLEQAALVLASRSCQRIPMAEWARIGGDVIASLRSRSIVDSGSAEGILHQLLGTSLLQSTSGEIGFAHRTLLEFLVARASRREPQNFSGLLSVDKGVARFLCGMGADVEWLLEAHFARCLDVKELVPLLVEAEESGSSYGRFEELHWAIYFGENVGHAMVYDVLPGDKGAFSDDIEGLVDVCLQFGCKSISVLKDGADGIVRAAVFDESRQWLKQILAGLEAMGWVGFPLYERLIQLGYFEHVSTFMDDGASTIHAFLEHVRSDEFEAAAAALDELAVIRAVARDSGVSSPPVVE